MQRTTSPSGPRRPHRALASSSPARTASPPEAASTTPPPHPLRHRHHHHHGGRHHTHGRGADAAADSSDEGEGEGEGEGEPGEGKGRHARRRPPAHKPRSTSVADPQEALRQMQREEAAAADKAKRGPPTRHSSAKGGAGHRRRCSTGSGPDDQAKQAPTIYTGSTTRHHKRHTGDSKKAPAAASSTTTSSSDSFSIHHDSVVPGSTATTATTTTTCSVSMSTALSGKVGDASRENAVMNSAVDDVEDPDDSETIPGPGGVLFFFGKSRPGAHVIRRRDIVEIAAHGTRSAVLLTAGGLVLCYPNGPPGCELGRVAYTPLVHIPAPEKIKHVCVGTLSVLAIGVSGKLYCCKDVNNSYRTFEPLPLNGVEEVHVGSDKAFAFARLGDGTLWGWGDDIPCISAAPVQIIVHKPERGKKRKTSSCEDKELEDNSKLDTEAAAAHQLDPDRPDTDPSTEVGSKEAPSMQNLETDKNESSKLAVKFLSFDCGDSHIAALSQEGDVWVWGYNISLVADSDDSIISAPYNVLEGKNITSVVCGRNVTYATAANGSTWLWGDVGNHIYHPSLAPLGFMGFPRPCVLDSLPPHIKISCGANHYGALSSSGDLWMWGSSESCRLGCTEEVHFNETLARDFQPRLAAKNISQVVCGSSYTLVLSDPACQEPQLVNQSLEAPTKSGRVVSGEETPSTSARTPRTNEEHEHPEEQKEQVLKGFGDNPIKALKQLVDLGVIANAPGAVAREFHCGRDFTGAMVGSFLGSEGSEQVLLQFLQLLDFSKLNFEMALRRFLWSANLPGESQQIDRMMRAFSSRYFDLATEHGVFKNKSAIYQLSFSCLMLNTSRHNPSAIKLDLKKWIASNEELNDNQGFPQDFLQHLFFQIDDLPFQFYSPESAHYMMQGILVRQGTINRRLKCTLDSKYFTYGTKSLPVGALGTPKVNGEAFVVKNLKGVDVQFATRTEYTANVWAKAITIAATMF
ncbi:pleckstrin homology, Sec7 and coiled-coil domains 1 [Pelomyxa schiedti]|nr:pleckstrin homology, Sec7 and coiled-coil domains 1 [Pelomyxa schiedti]